MGPMFHLSLSPIADSYPLVALLAAVLIGLLWIGPTGRRLTKGRRWTLALIRLALVLLIVGAGLRPTLVYSTSKKQPATVALMIDQSRSMSVADMASGRSRWDFVASALDQASPSLKRLAADIELNAYGFDVQTQRLIVEGGRPLLPESPLGKETALGAAIDDVLRLEAGKRLLAVVLLSDGAQRAMAPRDVAPQIMVGRMKTLGTPLFTLTFGQARGLGQARDLAVKDLLVSPTVFVKNELTIEGQVRIDGFVNRQLAVRLLFETSPGKMTAVAEQTVSTAVDGALLPVKLSYVPEIPGEHKLTLEIVAQPGELVTTNNAMSTFVHVVKGGLNVLYIEGSRRVEAKFLRRALDSSPDIKVDYLFIDPRRPNNTKPPDFAERFTPGKYDVYLLGDIDSSAFSADEMKSLAEAVDRGAGMAMLGGFHSFGPGGYQNTPLADVLPVRAGKLERQELNGPIDLTLHIPGPLRLQPTPIGLMHFALNLGATRAESQAIWAQLPPLDGANRFTGLAMGAAVLADDQAGSPLVVSQMYGNGRVMAIAVDSTWRWWMQGRPSIHKRFWRQVVLWLAKRDQAQEGDIWIRLDKRRLNPGERVEFRVGANGPSGEPMLDADFELRATGPNGLNVPLRLVGQGEQTIGSFRETKSPGDYALELKASHRGEPLGETRARFLVAEQDLELDNPSADPATMQSIAGMTGGRALPPEELPALAEELLRRTEELESVQETKRTLWDTWPFFFCVVCLMGTEWFLRKRWGLV